MHKLRLETALRFLLYGGMIVVAVFYQLRPLNDPDFFWHLKNGEWIWQHRELPAQDPFNLTSRIVDPARQRFVLTSYWLSEVLYHLLHERWGIPGIVSLKFLIAALLALALLRLRRGDPLVHSALVLAALPLLYGLYPLDRPQAFSFLFFATLLFLLEKARTSPPVPPGWGSLLPILLLMLAWANMHGGHAVGQATIVLYLALEGVKFLHPALRPAGRRRYQHLLIAGAAGLAASLINPNSHQALRVAFAPAPGYVVLLDYLPTVQFFREVGDPLVLVFWGALALACLSAVWKPDITSIALLAGTGYAGFSHIRHVPFFMIAALPVIGAFLSAVPVRTWARLALVAGAVALTAHFSRSVLPSRETVGIALRVNDDIFPVQAADFVAANDLRGNLYNIYFWGGYLLWRLGPERQVFADGRGINPQMSFDAASINMAFARPGEPTPYWKSLLRRYGIGHLILPRAPSRRGIVFEDTGGLTAALLGDPDWVPIYADEIALVFVLNTPEHGAVIQKHGIPKDRPLERWLIGDVARGDLLMGAGRLEEAAAAYREAIRTAPGNPEAWHSLGCALGELGRPDEAAAAFEETLRLRPGHPAARENLELTRSRRSR